MSSTSGMFSLDASTRHTPTQAQLMASPRRRVQHQQPQDAKPAPTAQQPAAPAFQQRGAAAGAGAAAGPGGAGPAGEQAARGSGKPNLKAMSRAERRELQEAQVAAKAAQKGGAPAAKGAAAGASTLRKDGSDSNLSARAAKTPQESRPSSNKGPASSDSRRLESAGGSIGGREGGGGAASAAGHSAAAGRDGAAAEAGAPLRKKKDPKAVSLNSTELFAHLQQYKRVTANTLLASHSSNAMASIHPAILQLGLRYADGSVRGANARCMAMLNALSQVIRDYSTPPGKELIKELQRSINTNVDFLVVCRPMSVSMGNAVRYLKMRLSPAFLPRDIPDAEAKELLLSELGWYTTTRVETADTQLVRYAQSKIEQHGDVVLTYAASYAVQRALIEAANAGKRFRVVVLDARPELEGRITLQKLLAAGIPCSYVHLNAASYIIREVTKVFLGAAAVLSNGTVLSRAGTASVAMMAHAHSKPVMILCESHKFHERVQLDSITHNELGDAEALASVPGRPEVNACQGWAERDRLRLLNLKYDVMPAEYVTMIVSEFGMVPATSVPAILREFSKADEKLINSAEHY